MHQIQVEVVGAKVLQGCIESGLNVIRMVRVVPQFGGNKDLLSGYTTLPDGLATSGLSAITGSRQYGAKNVM